jgi:hypothetical protein
MVDGRLQHPFLQASIYDRRKITEFLAEHMSHVEHHLSMGCNDHPAKDERKQVILYNSYEQKNMFSMNSSINCFFFHSKLLDDPPRVSNILQQSLGAWPTRDSVYHAYQEIRGIGFPLAVIF